MTPQLSICIPTYNFGRFIGAAIDSFAPLPAGVELLVVDGASTDDTEAVVAARMAEMPAVRYERLPQRGGIDHDMAKAVELARGDFCWLFSADDVAHPGALTAVLARLDDDVDVFLLSHSNCTIDMSVVDPKHRVLLGGDGRVNLADANARIGYFRNALSTEAFFSYMSGLCVRRTAWFAGKSDPRFDRSCWAHSARLLSLIQSRLVVDYLDAPCIDRRGDNDSFFDGSVVRRYAIAIDGYQLIGNTLFGNGSEEAYHIRRVLRSELGPGLMLSAKYIARRRPELEDRQKLDALVESLYSDPEARRWRWAYSLIPAQIVPVLRSVFKALKHAWGKK